jgi:hypothetical protein
MQDEINQDLSWFEWIGLKQLQRLSKPMDKVAFRDVLARCERRRRRNKTKKRKKKSMIPVLFPFWWLNLAVVCFFESWQMATICQDRLGTDTRESQVKTRGVWFDFRSACDGHLRVVSPETVQTTWAHRRQVMQIACLIAFMTNVPVGLFENYAIYQSSSNGIQDA